MTLPDRRDSNRQVLLVRMVFGILALISLMLGLGLYLFAAQLGLDDTTARLITTAFLIAAAIDAIVVGRWGRISGRKD